MIDDTVVRTVTTRLIEATTVRKIRGIIEVDSECFMKSVLNEKIRTHRLRVTIARRYPASIFGCPFRLISQRKCPVRCPY